MEPPQYCEYYKHLLVEEIHYLKHPIDLHYGLCSVIGRMSCKEGRYELENIGLSCLDKRHRLHTGAVTILLKVPGNLNPPLPRDEYVEIFGEAIFEERDEYDKNDGHRRFAGLPANSGDLIHKLRIIKTEVEREEQGKSESQQGDTDVLINTAINRKLDEWRIKLEPAILVDSFKAIAEAETVILCNLQLRAVQMKKRRPNACGG